MINIQVLREFKAVNQFPFSLEPFRVWFQFSQKERQSLLPIVFSLLPLKSENSGVSLRNPKVWNLNILKPFSACGQSNAMLFTNDDGNSGRKIWIFFSWVNSYTLHPNNVFRKNLPPPLLLLKLLAIFSTDDWFAKNCFVFLTKDVVPSRVSSYLTINYLIL